MEIDERLFKRILDQLELLTELDINRRIDEIHGLFEELPGLAQYDDNPYKHRCEINENRRLAYEKVSEKLFVIKKHIETMEKEIKNLEFSLEFSPKYKKRVDKEIKDIRSTYNMWKSKCKNALIDDSYYSYDANERYHYFGRL